MMRAESSPRWVEGEDVVIPTELTYRPGEPVRSSCGSGAGGSTSPTADAQSSWQADRRRGLRLPSAWVAAHALNVNRRGVVFVQSNEARLEALVERVAACSAALVEELLEHE
jgi:hypothetical protein